MNRLMKVAVMFCTGLTLAACSSVPDELSVPKEAELVAYTTALETPESVVGKTARWGGVIAEVRNSDAGTVVEVVNFPLNSWGRPIPDDESTGRFRANIKGFVDPMVYTKGSEVTFTGTINNAEKGSIGEFTYLFPVLNVSGKKLWPERKDNAHAEVNYGSLWYRHYYYTRPFYPSPVYIPSRATNDKPKQSDQNQ